MWAINGIDIQPRIGSFSVRICRARRPALEAKTKVPASASVKASPTARVRRHVSPTIQYIRFPLDSSTLGSVLNVGGPYAAFSRFHAGRKSKWSARRSLFAQVPAQAANRAADPIANPSQRVQPAQVAALLVHLASDAGAHVTGAAIPICSR